MSYLDSPRLHFRGWFQADVSTINNTVEFFQNDSFVPQYQELNQNGSWNPEGTGIFRLLDCSVTGAFLDGRLLVTPGEDPVIGMSLQNADRRAPGKLVDLDPQQQMVSEIWGMQVRLVNGAAQELLQGEYKPAAFINLWKRQQSSMLRDQTLAAYYQSVLEGVTWPDATGSPLLDALKAATHEDRLSIHFNVFGYGRDSKIPRYTLGHVVGTIGPYRSGEPRHFVLGRQMVADTPSSPVVPAQGVGSLQAKLSGDGMWLTADFGNSFPIQTANSGLMDIGRVSIGVLDTNPVDLQATVDVSRVIVIGDVPYLEPPWYTQTAGVQAFDLSGNAAARQVLPGCPLVLITPVAGTTAYKVLLQETIDGVYVRADQFVFRIDPGETQQVELHASRFGAPLAGAAIDLSATVGMMGGGGDSIDPPVSPPAKTPIMLTPADAISYAAGVTTDARGRATLALSASAAGPGTPRGYLAGQLYGLGYQLATQPPGYVSNVMNYVSILAYSAKAVPETPTWYQDIEPLFTQYAHLYPIMSRHVVDLSDYASVVSRIAILKLAFSLPPRDPNHMPVTRDLGAGDRATILKWLGMKGPDGLPPLGIKPVAPPAAPAAKSLAPGVRSMPALPPEQAGGKAAVILAYEHRRASTAAAQEAHGGPAEAVSLISRWFIRPGCEQDVIVAVQQLSARVQAEEPDTLTYLVHTPFLADKRLQALPPADPSSLLFFEVYRNADAFLHHLHGPVFADFVAQYGQLFVQANGNPFTTVEFLSLRAGFNRLQPPAAAAGAPDMAANQHPAVMFEVIGRDQGALQTFYTQVFGWKYQAGTGGFAYVNFPLQTLPLLGGIGQANPAIPGFEPGHTFYLLVDDLDAAIDRALAAGGSRYMDPATVDGYQFAMVRDPEGNPIGLIKPFNPSGIGPG